MVRCGGCGKGMYHEPPCEPYPSRGVRQWLDEHGPALHRFFEYLATGGMSCLVPRRPSPASVIADARAFVQDYDARGDGRIEPRFVDAMRASLAELDGEGTK